MITDDDSYSPPALVKTVKTQRLIVAVGSEAPVAPGLCDASHNSNGRLSERSLCLKLAGIFY